MEKQLDEIIELLKQCNFDWAALFAGVGIFCSIILYNISRKNEMKDLKVKDLQKQLSEFFYPFLMLSRENKILFEIFSKKYIDKDTEFRTFIYLLNNGPKYFKGNDSELLASIIKIDNKLLKLINDKGWLVESPIAFNSLNKAAIHYSFIIKAYQKKFAGEENRFENFIHPNDLDQILVEEILKINIEITKIRKGRMKKENNCNYWEKIYNRSNTLETGDNWVCDYFESEKQKGKALNLNGNVLDLGCGDGVNIGKLINLGCKKIYAIDFAKEAISKLGERLKSENIDDKQVKTLIADFENQEIKNFFELSDKYTVIISDLSLHYFGEATTKRIIRDIYDNLKDDGYFLCRVNSIKEAFLYSEIKEIESHYYKTGEINRRFFDLKDIEHFFKDFKIVKREECFVQRYGNNKYMWEIIMRKN